MPEGHFTEAAPPAPRSRYTSPLPVYDPGMESHDREGNAAPLPELSRLRIALVGYGEVGTIFGTALGKAGVARVAAYDLKARDAAWLAANRERAAREGVALEARLGDALRDADLVVSAVTAAQARTAAEAIATAIRKGAFVLDVNSSSPGCKSGCAAVVDAAGGRYVEAAVMAAVPPYGLAVPMVLGGPHADAIAPRLAQLGFRADVGSTEYGRASAIKLCRSVVVKGIEALAVESLLAARRYGVEREVLASLVETFPGMKWDTQADYLWRRVYQHGARRAEEMREAAHTVDGAGVVPRMAAATAEVQAWIAERRAQGDFDGLDDNAPWPALADRIARDPAKD